MSSMPSTWSWPEARGRPRGTIGHVPVTRMNHAVLYIRDLDRSVAFYRDVLGFRVVFGVPGRAAFMQAPASNNDHDLGLFQIGDAAGSQAGRGMVGLYHLAWEVDTLDELDRI